MKPEHVAKKLFESIPNYYDYTRELMRRLIKAYDITKIMQLEIQPGIQNNQKPVSKQT
ncbi:MAG: hypothetical protein WCC06_12320 [Candidatus Aminicenantales bacterium]